MNLINLRREIDSWVTESIITKEQSKKLYQKYKLSDKPTSHKEATFILKALSIFLVGLAFFLVIKENWSNLSVLTKSLTGLLPLISILIFAVQAVVHKHDKKKTELLFFFTHLLIGVNIFLQTEIFEIFLSPSVKILAWSTVIFIITVYFKDSLNLLLLLLVLTIFHTEELQTSFVYWFSIPIFGASGYLIYLNMNRLNFLVGVLNLFLFGISIHLMIHGNNSLTTNVSFFQLSSTSLLILSALPWLNEKLTVSFLQKIKYIFYFFSLMLFCSFFIRSEEYNVIFEHPPTLTNIVYFCLGLVAYFMTNRNLFLTITTSLLSYIFFLNIAGYYLHDTSNIALKDMMNFSFFVTSNIIFFIFCLVSVYHGLHNKAKEVFLTGVVMILMLIFTHYVNHADEIVITALIFLMLAGVIYYLNNVWNKKMMVKIG